MASQKGLGRGLGALLGDLTEEPESTGGLKTLPLHKIEPNPNQPRRDFDDEELEALAESIRQHGIIQPLTVREMPNGYYQIIAGERRWRASRLAGLDEVPVVIMEADDRKAMELALIENLQRQDLNPVEEAQGYDALINRFGLTQEEAAERVGKSRPAVTNALRLLTLSEPAGKAEKRRADCRSCPGYFAAENRKKAAGSSPEDCSIGSLCPSGGAAVQEHEPGSTEEKGDHPGSGLCSRVRAEPEQGTGPGREDRQRQAQGSL